MRQASRKNVKGGLASSCVSRCRKQHLEAFLHDPPLPFAASCHRRGFGACRYSYRSHTLPGGSASLLMVSSEGRSWITSTERPGDTIALTALSASARSSVATIQISKVRLMLGDESANTRTKSAPAMSANMACPPDIRQIRLRQALRPPPSPPLQTWRFGLDEVSAYRVTFYADPEQCDHAMQGKQLRSLLPPTQGDRYLAASSWPLRRVSVRGRGGNSAVSARRAECPITWSSARA